MFYRFLSTSAPSPRPAAAAVQPDPESIRPVWWKKEEKKVWPAKFENLNIIKEQHKASRYLPCSYPSIEGAPPRIHRQV